MLYVEGKIRNRTWDDKEGNKRYTSEIEADNFQMLGPKNDDGGQPATGVSNQESAPTSSEFTPNVDFAPGTEASDDLPF